MSSQEKTEKATPKKRKDERKKGNIFQSKDMITVALIASSFYTLKAWIPYVYQFLKTFQEKYYGYIGTVTSINPSFVTHVFIDIFKLLFMCSGILFFVIIIVSIIATGAQTKFIFSMKSLKPKFSKLNPLKGFKKLFSLKSLVELLKNLVKISIIAVVLLNTVKGIIIKIPSLMYMDIMSGIIFTLNVVMSVVNNVIIYFVAISAIDYLYQWYDYEKNIKMSKQEIKDEYKNLEGDPQIKGKIKEKQRAMSAMRMMQQVPEADVVIKNPTHFAVAIKYDVDKYNAPIVIAKGQDSLALRIIKKANDNNVYVIENRPLARALYAVVDLNHEIPVQYYEAIAEILAWVFRLRQKGK